MDSLTEMFLNEGLQLANHDLANSPLTGYRRFRCFFGIAPDVLSKLWNLLSDKPHRSEPKHLLWCAFFLKNYNKEHVNAAIANVDEKTFRLWTWRFIYLLSNLDVVKWENRFKNSVSKKMNVTLDGTDFRIREPKPFNKKWFSHKFNGPGIRYELGLSIVEGDVVWASGGLPCGEWNDLAIAKDLYVSFARKETTLADKIYRLKPFFKQPSNATEKKILARHETLNGRIKEFTILGGRYRHALKKHPSVFHAVVNVIQVSISNGERLFEL